MNKTISNNHKNNYEPKSDKMKQQTSFLKRAVLSLIMLMLPLACVLAQGGGIHVKGTVVDGAGEPLIGASVVVKGNTSHGY